MQTPVAQTLEIPAAEPEDDAAEFVILEVPDRLTAEAQYGADIEDSTEMEANHV